VPPRGLRLQRSVHHPMRDTLAWLLTAVLGERMVIREDRDGGGRMSSFMQRFPGLGHQPDIVLEGFDGVTTRAGWPTGDGRQSRVLVVYEPVFRCCASSAAAAPVTWPEAGGRLGHFGATN